MSIGIDILSIVIGIVALIISIYAIFKSKEWNDESKRNLEKTQMTLEQIKDISRQIDQYVDKKMDDILKRAFPSQEEQAMNQIMPEIMTQVMGKAFEDPDMIKQLMQQSLEK